MTTINVGVDAVLSPGSAVSRPRSQIAVSAGFTAVAVALGTWLVLGMYVDAWAHHHLRFETFFTPWHALLYSGEAVNLGFFGLWWAWHRKTLPGGYELSFVGSILFAVGGFADLIWHAVFGIERDFAAILSPTHLVLMFSAGLIVSGPFRAAWRSQRSIQPYSSAWSMTLLVAVLFFFMQDLQPLVAQWPNPGWIADQFGLTLESVRSAGLTAPTLRITEQLGLVNMLLATTVFVGSLVTAIRRFALRPGQVFLVIAVPTIAVVLTYKVDPIIVVAVIAGIFGEAMYLWLRPSSSRTPQLRTYVVVVVGFLWAFHIWGLAATDGVVWPIHSELGVVVVSVVGAWLLTYVAFPPASATAALDQQR